MDTEGLDPQKLHGAPPLMPWQKFAEWIGMGDEPIVGKKGDRFIFPAQRQFCSQLAEGSESRTHPGAAAAPNRV